MGRAGVKPIDSVQAAFPHRGAVETCQVDADAQARSNILVVPVGEGAVLAPALLDGVIKRAGAGAAEFYVILPDPAAHAEMTAAQRRQSHTHGKDILERALSRLSEAAGSPVEGSVSIRHDPMDVIEEALRTRAVDEIMLALVRHPVAERLHLDLPFRVARLGIPVTTVTLEALAR
jgi:hypothetical protein